MNPATQPVRIHALNVLHSVICKQHKAKASIEPLLKQQQWSARDAGLLREMVYGVLRFYFSLEADVSRFIKTKPDEHSRLALLLGAYQLRHMRIPSHAAVGETVSAIKPYAPQAAGFVNAVLRQVAGSEAPEKLKPSQRAELPKWMYSSWRDAFGTDEVAVLAQSCKETPELTVAVFQHRDTWIEKVNRSGTPARAGTLSPFAVLLPTGTNVTELPGFEAGEFIVMDQAAQAAAMAVECDAEKEATILDLCAAPGGKTALLAARFPHASITAVELNEKRIPRLQENLKRLPFKHIKVEQADATALPYADNSVDAIMLDAPCTASGTLRRHPDAKFIHSKEELPEATQLQTSMVREALRALKPGGTLVYAVCSIHPEENEQVMEKFPGVQSMQRLFPSSEHDGFFFARIRKE